MRNPLRLLNLLLGLIAVLITAALAKTWVAPDVPIQSPVAKRSLQEAEAVAYNSTARPPLAQFDILLERNPFKQPPPMPVQPSSAPPPPPPLPTLVGTILVDHERRAILSDKGKANIYTTGQEVAGGIVTEIKEDRVIFKRGETVREITLKAAIESAAATPANVPAPVAVQSGAPDSGEIERRRQERLEMRQRRAAERATKGEQ
ncbi:MAG: hypothetical protein F9K13_10565 [Candidatus Methylomirabilis oxygeniifera]|uniref:Type II secretion system protein GspC N-terminal domain-containing protein n=1 Tax=Methylomirabilis oxygeniifera TaxID=671143 RepID=D5MJG8_METO1|nr:MAG: hypothetical protein F9K13_10565 [Candidatus Methylomirabilis oxyfera]CBE69553.1 exported protein of unknown function [Candidatus Methylomirabilis oxyfera]